MSDAPVLASSPEAKKMTEAEARAFMDGAFEAERKIRSAFANVSTAWWELSARLYEFHEAGYWAALGYASLDEFLAQPELGMSRSQFFQMTKAYRDLVVVKQIEMGDLQELEPSKVREVIPSIMRGDVDPEEALSDAASLSYRDVKAKYRPEERTKRGQSARVDGNDELDAEAEPERVQCGTCGQWWEPPEQFDTGLMLDPSERQLVLEWAKLMQSGGIVTEPSEEALIRRLIPDDVIEGQIVMEEDGDA